MHAASGGGGGARGYQRLRLRPFDANAVQLHQDVSALRVPGCHRVASGPVARRSRTRRASCTGARRDLDLPRVPPRAALEQLVHVQPAVEVFAECDAEPADAWDAPGRVEAAAALRKVIVLAAVAAQGQKRHGLAARKTGAPVRPPAGRHVSPLPECARPSALQPRKPCSCAGRLGPLRRFYEPGLATNFKGEQYNNRSLEGGAHF